mmetsp:Transcript_110634/g.219951  ORF Transcript_110634/g.219951 Transcript_110634/m.219951 type:complete len:186 (+) Transcript_110634:78-635(+)
MGQPLSILLQQCGSLEDVVIDKVLSWLIPLEHDFGPFSVSLKSASIDDEHDESHVDLKEFALEGIMLHGVVSADLPVFGCQELPINLDLGLHKTFQSKECEVTVHDINFEPNEHNEESQTKDRDLMGDLGSVAGGFMSGGLMGAFMQVLQLDSIKMWAAQQVREIVDEQLRDRLGDDDESDLDDE